MTQVEKSFVNSFWGKGDSGYLAIQARIKNSLQTLEEILAFLREKAHLEADFNKRMDKFYSQQQLGSAENGTLKVALDTLVAEGRNMVAHQDKLVARTSQQNYDKLRNFHQMYSKNVAKIESHMSKLHARRKDLEKQFLSCKEKYRANCGQIKTLTLICQTTCGKEMEKSASKLSKLQAQHESLRSAYFTAVKTYGDICDIWTTDWSIALSNIYQLEIERIHICKLNMFSFCNHVATLCVDWDSAIDNARSCFARVAAPADTYDFADTYGTGNQIYEPPSFVEFMDGLDDDNDGRTGPKAHQAQFKDPDYSAILSRTFSTPSGLKTRAFDGASPTKSPQNPLSPSKSPHNPQSPSKSPQKTQPSPRSPVSYADLNKQLPAIGHSKLETNFLVPDSEPHGNFEYSPTHGQNHHSNTQNHNQMAQDHNQMAQNVQVAQNVLSVSPEAKPLQKMPSHISNYTTGTENDVFDARMKNSNGSSEYSNTTTYSHATNSKHPSNENSGTRRSWASPRVNPPTDVQKEINRRSKDLSEFYISQTPKNHPKPTVPIAKDFSIDFIAQALQDLNAGGDGDIDRFRRSVRRSQKDQHPTNPMDAMDSMDALNGATRFPPSDYVDDMHETATRYGSINFETRSRRHTVDPRSQIPPAQIQAQNHAQNHNIMAPSPMSPTAESRHTQRMSFPSGKVNHRSALQSGSTLDSLDADSLQTVIRKNPTGTGNGFANGNGVGVGIGAGNGGAAHTSPNGFSGPNGAGPNGSSGAPRPRSLSQSPTKSFMNLQAIVDKVTPMTRRKYVTKAVAKHSYRCREAGELTFSKGWHMYVIHKQEDNWYVCELGENCGSARGSVGLVPYNYVVEGDSVF